MKNLKLLRDEKGLSQQELAKKIGTTQQNIHKYEHGTEPDIEMIKSLANYFETSIDYLVGNTDIRNKIEQIERFDLNKQEALLVEKYRKLNTKARKSVLNMVDALLDGMK